jgi:hypothetical protein
MALSGMAHQARSGHQGKRSAGRSPDLQIRLVEIAGYLADFENA